MENKPKSISGPLFLIEVGVFWLLIQSGYIPASNLWALTHIWPYVLIAAGVGLILRSLWKYMSIVMDVVIMGGVIMAVVFAPQLKWDTPFMNYIIKANNFNLTFSEPGSGNVVVSTRGVSGFNGVQIDYPAQVFISQGQSESVKIEADEKILPGLKTEVQNGQLRIYYQAQPGKPINTVVPVKITIVVKDLNDVSFKSAGQLSLEELKADNLNVSLSGAGDLKFDNIQVSRFTVNISGAGSMTASGAADALDVNISGFGGFNGQELHSNTAHVNLSGAGGATVWVDQELAAEVSGAGPIEYYGSANVTKQVNGVGSVIGLGEK